MTEHKPIPAPLAAAFADRLTISAAELCRLMPMDDSTLRRHIRAGNIAYRRVGIGPAAPRRFTLEDVMGFLEGVREQECPASSARAPRPTPVKAGGAVSGILDSLAQRMADRQKQRAAKR